MSRPHGCDANAASSIRNIKNAPSFIDARKALVSTLENLSFLKVVTVQGGPNGSYTGEAVEIHFRDSRERPKLVFFDKFGRSRSLFKIGPMNIVQAPLGYDHATSVPTIGEVLVGSLVPNVRKSHLEHVLRGWSSEAKPLYELLRILKFGTKSSEFECRSLLIQPSSSLIQSPDHIKQARDDIYMAARIILWGSIRPLQVLASIQDTRVSLETEPSEIELTQARGLRLSSKALDYFDSLTMKLADTNLSEAFLNGLSIKVQTYVPPVDIAHTNGLGYGHVTGLNAGRETGHVSGHGLGYGMPYSTEAYDPTTVFAVRPRTPPINDTDAYAPTSPPREYAPRSPYGSPPASPPYAPTSPAGSPPYAPTSPAGSPPRPGAIPVVAYSNQDDVTMASSLKGLYDDI